MRISDWSSDVCSSDLFGTRGKNLVPRPNPAILRFCCSNKANQFAVSVLWECLIRHPPIADEVEYKLIIPALRIGKKDHSPSRSKNLGETLKQLTQEVLPNMRRKYTKSEERSVGKRYL